MPRTTSALLACGVSGLMVVFARLKPSTAAMPMATAITRSVVAAGMRAGTSTSRDGKAPARNHISRANTAAMTGGGTRCSRRRNRNASLRERRAQRFGERGSARLVAVQAHGVGRDGHALAGKAGHVALLHHRQRLLHRLRRVLDHAAGLVARGERAVVGVAAIGEHLAGDRDAGALRDLVVLAVRKHV